MIYRKAKPQGTLLKEFHDHVGELKRPAHFIDNVLLPTANAYEQIVDAAYTSAEDAGEINERLRWLNRLEFTDWLPPALAFLTRHMNGPPFVRAFFGDLERLAYSMLIRKAGVNERIDRFSLLTRAIESGSDLAEDKSPLQLSASEQFATFERLNGTVYLTLGSRALSTLLVRLDALLSGGGAQYDYPTITVEHVLPQSPSPGSLWLQWFSDPADRITWTHRLGNLALLTRRKNSAASNYDFKTKKDAYFARGGISPFVLTTQVLTESDWTPGVVKARHGQLLGRLEKHWRLEGRKDPLIEFLTKPTE